MHSWCQPKPTLCNKIKNKKLLSLPLPYPTLLIRPPSVRVSPRWGCLASLLPGCLLTVGTAASQKKGDVSYCFVPLFRCPPLAQHMDITVMSTCYFRQHCVVVGQRCHRIASLLRLVLTGISSTHYCNINATLYWEAAGGGACRLFPILVFLFTRLLLVGNNIIIHSLQKKYPFGSKS